MNPFEQTLTEAKIRHRRRIVIGSLAILTVAIISLGGYFLFNFAGRVQVKILPIDAAEVANIQIIEGHGFVYQQNVWGINRPMKIRISADGFTTETIEVYDTTWSRGQVDVILREKPSIVQATTTPIVDDIQWYLNDALIESGNQINVNVEPGEYSLRAEHPYFVPIEQTLTVARGEIRQVTLALKPISGLLNVTSEPHGATVSINSRPQGQTPLKIDTDGGIKQLTLSLYGHQSIADEIRVTERAAEISRHYSLMALQIPHLLSLSPTGGTLTVNDRVVVDSDTTIKLTFVELTFGIEHTLQYSKPGYTTKEMLVPVNTVEPETLDIELQPKLGIVEVKSDPPAQITVNGKVAGISPQNLNLLTVPQTITASRPDYVSQTRTVTPVDDSTATVEFELLTVKEHRLRFAPSEYVNSVGIKMKLFKDSDTVTLGSQRGEIGRESHEFVRTVQLDRPFYVGIYEVTEDQFKQVSQPGAPAGGSKQPVAGIEWLSAAQFCNALSEAEGLSPVYEIENNRLLSVDPEADGYRLPTEAEWEWLARKAGRSQQTRFSWGNQQVIPKDTGNLADESAKGTLSNTIPLYKDGFPQTAEVGSFTPNTVGIHDLTGNVSEWTHDVYTLKPPAGTLASDALDTSTSSRRTIKGSSWQSATLTELRAAWRAGSRSADVDVGFRIARYLY